MTMKQIFQNLAIAEIATQSISTVATSFDVVNAEDLPIPAPGEFWVGVIFKEAGDVESDHEIVHVTAVSGNTLTVIREQENSRARTFVAGDLIELRNTAGTLERLRDGMPEEITRYRETVAAATTAIDRADGGIQTLTLTADSAITWTLKDGEKIQLYLTPSGFNLTDWGVDYWMTDVPTLATENMIVVEKVGGSIYAWDGGGR